MPATLMPYFFSKASPRGVKLGKTTILSFPSFFAACSGSAAPVVWAIAREISVIVAKKTTSNRFTAATHTAGSLGLKRTLFICETLLGYKAEVLGDPIISAWCLV